MNNIERGGISPEGFEVLPEDKKASNKEIQGLNDLEADDDVKKVTRRKFLQFMGGVAATIVAPELIMGQESEKNKVTDEEKKDPSKEAEIKSLHFLYEQAKKNTDVKKKNDLFENIGQRMQEGNITIDDLGIEAQRDKKIREFKKSFVFQISQKSPELQRKGLDLLYINMKSIGFEWRDLELESEKNESIMRLLPIDEQVEQAVWFRHIKEEIDAFTFNKNINVLINEKNKKFFLDLYYYNKNKFKVINYEGEGSNNEERGANEDFKGFFANIPFVAAALSRYKIDQEKDKELFEYLNRLSIEESKEKDKNK